MYVSIPPRIYKKYRQVVKTDFRRSSRPENQIMRIILGSLNRAGDLARLEGLLDRGQLSKPLELEVELFDYERRIGKYQIAVNKRKRKGRSLVVIGLH